ncbi:DNA-processing protein DprA [Bacillus sp. 2205SS5-2]|uniref:DNA-processing protein DprA n=1 Tax=Bacillus sp. 2205SS5-2 TaxID=3109031 RepID=UPI003006124B
METRQKLVHLLHCQTLGWKNIYCYLKRDPLLEKLYTSSRSSLQQAFQLTSQALPQLISQLHDFPVQDLMEQYEKQQISIVTILDESYPNPLKHIYQPPWGLFCIVNTSLLTSPKILAVIGARAGDQYAQQTINKLLPPLVKNEVVIVSGLAKGVDTMAHTCCIQNKGNTIAILGGGFSHIYPKENSLLAKAIANHHLLVSEYPPNVPPKKWHFPARNRIISGIAMGSLVIQAGKRSGSLITAEMALNEGRDVFSVPGPIHHPLSKGTNWLIQQGAKLVQSSGDILEEIE